jgi:seryl-tRNA synthetase
MNYNCEYCFTKFKSIRALKKHQKTAKYCLKKRGIDQKDNFQCLVCKKTLTTKHRLKTHQSICIPFQLKLNNEKWEQKMTEKMTEKDTIIISLKKQLDDQKKQHDDQKKSQEEYEDKFMDLLYSYQNLAELYVKDGKDNINKLNKKYLKRHKRTKYPGENVIYILTTSSLKKDRRYILGKAVNLTKRLSTYNKSDEHEVIFYASCPNKEKMSLVESMVFDKLCKCRERANRERFILPGDEDINLFSETIKDCINFVS